MYVLAGLTIAETVLSIPYFLMNYSKRRQRIEKKKNRVVAAIPDGDKYINQIRYFDSVDEEIQDIPICQLHPWL